LGIELERLANIGFRGAGKVEPPLQQGVVGLEISTGGPVALRRRVLTRQELRSQSARYGTRNLILQRKEILVRPIVALGPLRGAVDVAD
jgi:hypothetical protein